MKICIDMGHTPKSTGASKYLNELTEDRKIGYELISILKERGHEVINTTPPDTMGYPEEINYRCNKANASGAPLFVSIHLNAGGGTGTEVLYYRGDNTGYNYAKKVSAAVAAALELRDRGPKARTTEVGVIRDTVMTAILVEVCFVDSQADAAAYSAIGPKAVAEVIANALVGGAATKPASKPVESKPAEKTEKTVSQLADEVIAGKWGNGADRKKKLEAAGYNYDKVQEAVNQKLGVSTVKTTKSVDQLAKEVIDGKWGNGEERKSKLKAAGYSYTAVQKRVNEILIG